MLQRPRCCRGSRCYVRAGRTIRVRSAYRRPSQPCKQRTPAIGHDGMPTNALGEPRRSDRAIRQRVVGAPAGQEQRSRVGDGAIAVLPAVRTIQAQATQPPPQRLQLLRRGPSRHRRGVSRGQRRAQGRRLGECPLDACDDCRSACWLLTAKEVLELRRGPTILLATRRGPAAELRSKTKLVATAISPALRALGGFVHPFLGLCNFLGRVHCRGRQRQEQH
mmetsp:Transcript_19044/g.62063  ORF Transcript_19044/g.62063 Transcript_19044/m.62063 type:complete len:221 (-) Transcript_19044:108-770(-)